MTPISSALRTSSVESGESRLQAGSCERERERGSGGLGCSRREGVMREPLEGNPEMPNASSAAASSATRVPAAASDSVSSWGHACGFTWGFHTSKWYTSATLRL